MQIELWDVDEPDPERRTDLEEYAGNLARLLVTHRGRRDVFIISFPVDPARSGVKAATFERSVSRARGIAADCGYEVIDLYTMVRASRRDYLAPDGIHFNAKGHRVIADLVKRGFPAEPTSERAAGTPQS